MIGIRPMLALAILLAAVGSAKAQVNMLGPQSEPRDAQIRKALATDYMAPLLKAFVASVRKSADTACLQSKGFAERGRMPGIATACR